MDPLFDHKMPEWYNRLAILWYGVCLGVPVGFLLAMALGGYNAVHFMYAYVVMISSAVLATVPSIPKAYMEYRNRIRALKDGREKMGDNVRQRRSG